MEIKKFLEELERNMALGLVAKIVITDNSDYEPGLCNNGGRYSFSDVYFKVPSGGWFCVPQTSAEFCPYCHGWDCHGSECGGKPTLIHPDDILAAVGGAYGEDGITIDICGYQLTDSL